MIDWDRVRALRDEIGPEDFSEVVSLFLEEADEAISHLSPERGAEALARDLHYLKGAALNLGFRALSALCQAGERRAAAGDPGFDLAGLRDTYAACRAEFEANAAKAFAAQAPR